MISICTTAFIPKIGLGPADIFLVHDADFRASEKDWHSFVENMTEKLIEADDTVPELPVKDVVRRTHNIFWWVICSYTNLTMQGVSDISRRAIQQGPHAIQGASYGGAKIAPLAAEARSRVHELSANAPGHSHTSPLHGMCWQQDEHVMHAERFRSRAGRKSPYAHYYVQIAPGKSFVGK